MIKSLIKIISSNLLIQIIGIISFPILTLVYSIEEMSYLGTFTSCIAIFSVIFSLRAENNFFIISSIKKCNAYALFLYVVTISIALSFSLVVFFIFSINNLNERFIYYTSILGGLSYALFNIKYNHLVREGKENEFLKLKIFRMLYELASIFIAYLLDINIFIYIVILCLTYLLPIKIKKTSKIKLKLLLGYLIFKKNLVNIKYDFPASLLSLLTIYFPIIYFFISDDKIFSGIYFLCNRFIGAPSLLIAQAFNTTLKQYATTEYLVDKTCSKTIKKTSALIFIKMFPFYLIGLITLVLLYHYILSEDWKKQIYLSLFILPVFFFRFFFNCFSSVVYVMGLFKLNLYFQVISSIIAGLSLFIPNSLESKIFYFSILMSIYYISYTILILILSQKRKQYI